MQEMTESLVAHLDRAKTLRCHMVTFSQLPPCCDASVDPSQNTLPFLQTKNKVNSLVVCVETNCSRISWADWASRSTSSVSRVVLLGVDVGASVDGGGVGITSLPLSCSTLWPR